jgi:nitrogenase-stabilizing/protective protein
MSPFLAQIAGTSSAEEIFALLDLPAEPAVLNIARLQILRLMQDHVAAVPDRASEDEARAALRSALGKAYTDFLAFSPLKERVFAALREVVGPKRTDFVPLEALFARPYSEPRQY